jgi:hypothetical protein
MDLALERMGENAVEVEEVEEVGVEEVEVGVEVEATGRQSRVDFVFLLQLMAGVLVVAGPIAVLLTFIPCQYETGCPERYYDGGEKVAQPIESTCRTGSAGLSHRGMIKHVLNVTGMAFGKCIVLCNSEKAYAEFCAASPQLMSQEQQLSLGCFLVTIPSALALTVIGLCLCQPGVHARIVHNFSNLFPELGIRALSLGREAIDVTQAVARYAVAFCSAGAREQNGGAALLEPLLQE